MREKIRCDTVDSDTQIWYGSTEQFTIGDRQSFSLLINSSLSVFHSGMILVRGQKRASGIKKESSETIAVSELSWSE